MMKSIQLTRGSVYYRELGKGAPLLLLHANPGDSRDFDVVIPELAKHYRVIALDWPGYGQSAPPPDPEKVDVFFFHRLFVEFLDALNLHHVSIIGNSVGGEISR